VLTLLPKRKTQTLLEASGEVGLEVCGYVSSPKCSKKSLLLIAIKSFENVAVAFVKKFKSRLNLGNACYHSVQSLLSSRLLINRFVLYGCGSWSLALREEHSLREFENRVLRRIFGPGGGGKWREPGKGCIMTSFMTCTLYHILLGYQIKKICRRNAYNISVGNREGKRLLGRPRRRWEDNIRMDLREIGCEGLGEQWRAVVNTVANFRVP
jgi:hypothetical protein